MRSLITPNFNWGVYIILGLVIRLCFLDVSSIGFIAIMLSLYQFMLLFDAIGHFIPVRYLLGSFMCVQFFIGPALAYNGLDQYQYFLYKMAIPEAEYFAYALPAVMAFIIGLHLFAGHLKGEVPDDKKIQAFVERNPKIPYTFIIIGFLASIIASFFSSDLAFVFYLLGSFKFIGLFLMVLGQRRLKLWPTVIVIGSIVSTSFGEGMFHDLLTWIIFTASVFAIKYKISFRTKMIGASAFILFALTIQLVKSNFRSALAKGGDNNGLETFANVVENNNQDNSLFSFGKIAQSNVRINQGFIITNIMRKVPAMQPFENGAEMYRIFEAAIMPRILAPNKLNAGDRQIFSKYSGIGLRQGTSMGLSSLGDAYINWGVTGGVIFMFGLGLLYSAILNLFYKHSKDYPILILFTALSFYYPIRPDCELQTILGHLFKSMFLIFVILVVWKYNFLVPKMRSLSKRGQPIVAGQ